MVINEGTDSIKAKASIITLNSISVFNEKQFRNLVSESKNEDERGAIGDPVERYALSYNDEIKFAFHIQPKKTDTLQRGTVQPANGKRGGGKEAYFAKGTAAGTFLRMPSFFYFECKTFPDPV
jgi:hypothetical protein